MEEHFHARFFAPRAVDMHGLQWAESQASAASGAGRAVFSAGRSEDRQPRPAVRCISDSAASHAAGFVPRRAQRGGQRRDDMTCVGISVYITHVRIRHILSVECRRDFSIYFEKLYLSTAVIRLCQRKARAIRQKSHCSRIPDMVKYPRKTGETSDLAES